jgi:hypothetical protein
MALSKGLLIRAINLLSIKGGSIMGRVKIKPSSVEMDPRESTKVTFTATLENSTNQNFAWAVAGGWITQSGGNTADYKAPSDYGNYTVTAISLEDPTQSATATVTVKYIECTGLAGPDCTSCAQPGRCHQDGKPMCCKQEPKPDYCANTTVY